MLFGDWSEEKTAVRPGRKTGAVGGFECQVKKPELPCGSVRVIEGLIRISIPVYCVI